jgi:glycosyltransferase involved in cell wall biosynthesis
LTPLSMKIKDTAHNRSRPLVVHVISGLLAGGAEMMLYRLLKAMRTAEFDSEVISLTDHGQMGEKFEEIGVKVTAIGMKRGIPNPRCILQLRKYLQKLSPSLLQTWMVHSDLIGGWIGKRTLRIPVVWTIHSDIIPFIEDRSTYVMMKLGAFFSAKIPTRIVFCSEASRRSHMAIGYDQAKSQIIPNGFDLRSFFPNPHARCATRDKLKLSDVTPVIGLFTRYDRRKDIPNFIFAAERIVQDFPKLRLLICGNGMSWENSELVQLMENAGISENCFLLGRREDVSDLMSGADIVTSSSSSEAFPVTLGEAMACGVPCVATDVGDSALIIGDTGIIVPPKNPQALADGWEKILIMDVEERRTLGRAARQRIEENFSLDSVVARYENLYRELLTSP